MTEHRALASTGIAASGVDKPAAAECELFESVASALVDSRLGERPGAVREFHFGSRSLPRHLLRGAVGFGSLIGSLALLPVLGPFSVLLAPVGMVALRGCPSCWLMGLRETMSRGRLERVCKESGCSLMPGEDAQRAAAPARSPRGGR